VSFSRCRIYPIPRSAEDSSGVPQTRQITAEQSPQVSGSSTSRAQFGQYSASGDACLESAGSVMVESGRGRRTSPSDSLEHQKSSFRNPLKQRPPLPAPQQGG